MIFTYLVSIRILQKQWKTKIKLIGFGSLAIFIFSTIFLVLPNYIVVNSNTTKQNNLNKKYQLNFVDINQNSIKTTNDKIVILEYWSYNCGACFKKMKMLEELAIISKNDVTIICAHIGFNKSGKIDVEKYHKAYDKYLTDFSNLHFVFDSTYNLLDLSKGVPQTFIFPKEGKIIWSDLGYNTHIKKKVLSNYLKIIDKNS
jgi:thiol-disulfide isomerase/thioredoxin